MKLFASRGIRTSTSSRRPLLEVLENRELLSASPSPTQIQCTASTILVIRQNIATITVEAARLHPAQTLVYRSGLPASHLVIK